MCVFRIHYATTAARALISAHTTLLHAPIRNTLIQTVSMCAVRSQVPLLSVLLIRAGPN